MFAGPVGKMSALSFDRGEKKVSTFWKSKPSPRVVVVAASR